jgi:hypothetical protein
MIGAMTWKYGPYGVVFGLIRFPGRPSTSKLVVEVASVLLIGLGIAGELGAGIKITIINVELRGKSADLRSKGDELRSKSNQVVALLMKQASDAQLETERLRKQIAWQYLTPAQ